jgi:isopenicillin-N N-acyltransferase-like protein
VNSQSIPIIELDQQSPLQRGRAYGESAREQIQQILKVYNNLFKRVTEETWQQSVERGKPFFARAEAFAPDLVEEIQGIAEGADRSIEDILLLNTRSEILHNPQMLSLECTSLAALPESTRDSDMLLAQNWDWYKDVLHCQVILKITGSGNTPSLITFTEAGQLAKIGMNSAGIGLVVNNLISDQPRVSVPWIFLTRRVLESSYFAQAIGYILNTPRAHSINFLIATAEGEAVDLETSPVEDHVFWPEKGLIAHTNHYIQPGMKFRDLKPTRTLYLSTYLRLRRVQKEMANLNCDIETEAIRRILSDHMDRPFSVCAHENPAVPPPMRGVTCLSIIMNLTRKQIHYNLGNPCRGNYLTIKGD